jgi:hypothetical protein
MAVLKKHDTSQVLKSAAPTDFVLPADHTVIPSGVATQLKHKRDAAMTAHQVSPTVP